jgi:hypothetical protein
MKNKQGTKFIGKLMLMFADYVGKPKIWGNLPEDSRRFKLVYNIYSIGCDLCAPTNEPRINKKHNTKYEK